jgi:glycosyltransferase involved in cell wall biosynthesis
VRITARRSTLALAKTEDTARRVRALKSPQVRLFSEAGLSDAELAGLNRLPIAQSGPMRFISIGRLLHWKGFELGLRAFAKLGQTHPDATYCVVGDGPERRRLEQISQRLGLSGRVEFCGKLLRADVLGKLSDCDVLVHPSLHDSGGWVCLEAMAAGRPVICLDHGGPSTQVTRETGFKISARSPGQCIEDIASAMRLLASDRLLAAKMGLAGRKHVNQQFAWSQKAPAIVNLYESCSTQRQPSDWSATHVGV